MRVSGEIGSVGGIPTFTDIKQEVQRAKPYTRFVKRAVFFWSKRL
jgi:hypothetical protein